MKLAISQQLLLPCFIIIFQICTFNHHTVGPSFPVNQYTVSETQGQVGIHLTAPFLTYYHIPSFTGNIEVDIIVEGLPSDDPRQSADFGTSIL